MAKRRPGGENEVSLFPFLSILACLIGALVLMIVVLVMAQTDKAEGRTPEEIRMAQDVLKMQKELKERTELDALLKEKLAVLEKAAEEQKDLEQRLANLRRLLSQSKESIEQTRILNQNLLKQLDDLLLEIEGLKEQQAELSKEIAALKAEIEKRKIPPDRKPPPVIVQPSGQQMSKDTKVFFVEAGGGALKILGAWGEDYRLSAVPKTIIADHNYNYFLSQVARNKDNIILFLVRDDGVGAFTYGAGWAEEKYGVKVSKMPVPGRGDLQPQFPEATRGTMPPPPPPDPAAPPADAPPAKPAA